MISLQTLLITIISILGAIFFLGFLIFAYFYGRSTIKDNPENGAVFIKTGNHINKPVKAKRTEVTNKGSIYMYSKGKTILVPSSYKEEYYRQRRMIFINRAGQLIATPSQKDIPLSADEKDTLIYELVSSHIGADGMRALKGRNKTNILVVAVVAFIIGIIAIVGFNYFQENMIGQQTTQPKPKASQEIPIEVK